MKAAVITRDSGRKVLTLTDVPDPVLGAGDVMVQVSHAGICGSDLHGFIDSAGTSRTDGLIMGHEAAGVVVEVGSGVTGVAVGQRVTVDPQVTCGECLPCRNGWISICERKGVIGSSLRGFVQGSMAELVAVAAHQVVPVPDEMPLEQASLIEPLSNALHVVKRAPRDAEVAVVLGAGPLGLCLVQCLKAYGARQVVVSDVAPSRLALASRLGADVVVDAAGGDIAATVQELTGGLGADLVVESVGVDVTYQQAIAISRKRGSVMFFGAVQPTVTLPLLPILHKELNLIGCTGANDETPEAVQLVADGTVDVDAMITHQFPLEQAQQAMDVLSERDSGAIKVQVLPGAAT